jgi:hypothetical protein
MNSVYARASFWLICLCLFVVNSLCLFVALVLCLFVAPFYGTLWRSTRVSSDFASKETTSMKKLLTFILLTLCLALCSGVQAQTTTGTSQADANKEDEVNLETQLYLIVGTNQDVVESKLPTSLDTIIRQLRANLPFRNYRLAATLINRVKNQGRLDLSWIGGPLASAGGPASAGNPSFSSFTVRQVRLVRSNEGQQLVQMQGFDFGARIPIQTSGAIAANGAVAPVINYEHTGLKTDISMRESEPVIVGTLNVGPSGDAIILVVAAKRTSN